MKSNTKAKAKPAFEVRLNHIRATVWENSGGEGRTWFNTTITRRYQDGDEGKDTTTFNGLADLAIVAEAVRMCQEYVRQAEVNAGFSSQEANE